MKSSLFSATPWLSGAAALGALALAGCGGGTGKQSPSPTPTPSPSPNLLNTIVFVSNRDGNNEIYSMRSDGSLQTRLTTSPSADNAPSRSRDGRRIVFSSLRAGNPEIYAMDITGETSNLVRLTTDGPDAAPDDTAPTFSADGTKIAWISTRGGASNVWLMDSSGANQRQLTTEGNISSVAFSPDGTEVAFSVARTANAIIVGRNLATGAERILAQGAFSALSPRYSPGGTQLVFTARTSNSDTRRLRLVNLATGALSDGPGEGNGAGNFGLSAAFSPDGSRLTFETVATQSPQIGVAPVSGSSTVAVLTSQGVNSAPSWGQ